MSKKIFANGMEISARKDKNKSLCAMPDVCLSPPSPPAGPIPIPYPNTAKGSDTSSGSRSVKIGGDEAGLKNGSNYKKSRGDEAATRTLGMGVVTHTLQGKMKHSAWSMDVKFEGKNVIRHMDITTHNHINSPNLALTLNQAGQAIPKSSALDCDELADEEASAVNNDLDHFEQGNTLATASYTDPTGDSVLMKAVSHDDMVMSGCSNGYSPAKPWPMEDVPSTAKNAKKGQTKKKRKKGPVGKACQETSPYHGQAMGHSESRIIEGIIGAARKKGVSMPGGPGSLGKLTMNIHWKPTEGGDSNQPCHQSCQDLICEAIECGLDIQLCENGEETPPPCNKGKWST